jgi:hypothetical protein
VGTKSSMGFKEQPRVRVTKVVLEVAFDVGGADMDEGGRIEGKCVSAYSHVTIISGAYSDRLH